MHVCFYFYQTIMDKRENISALLNKLSKSGIRLNEHESFDCLNDYFTSREIESDEDDNESDQDLDIVLEDIIFKEPSDSNVAPCDITDSNVETSHITDSNAETSQITDSNVIPCDILDSNVEPCDIMDSNVEPCDITDSNAETSQITDSNVIPCDIMNSNVEPCDILDSNVEPCDIMDSNVEPCDITDSNVETSHITDSNAETSQIIDSNAGTSEIIDSAKERIITKQYPLITVDAFNSDQLKSSFSELTIEQDRQKVVDLIKLGCGCRKGFSKKSCVSQLNENDIFSMRLDCFELDYREEHQNKLNDVIVAELNALMHTDPKRMHANISPLANENRDKYFVNYMFRGHTICRKTFLFLHGIGRKRLRLLMTRLTKTGIAPAVHGNTSAARIHRTLTFEDAKNVVSFLNNYAENNAMILPGRVAGNNQSDFARLKLLPSSESKRGLHRKYVESCGEQFKPVSETTFKKIWKQTMSNLLIQRPRSDMCLKCQ